MFKMGFDKLKWITQNKKRKQPIYEQISQSNKGIGQFNEKIGQANERIGQANEVIGISSK